MRQIRFITLTQHHNLPSILIPNLCNIKYPLELCALRDIRQLQKTSHMTEYKFLIRNLLLLYHIDFGVAKRDNEDFGEL